MSVLVDKAEELVKGLSSLKCPIDQFDVWFVHFIERKLDPETRVSWAIHEENNDYFSTYKVLLQFLEHRITSLKSSQESYETPKP